MRKRERARARKTRDGPRVSPSRAPVFSCAHYFQAPATQARKLSNTPRVEAYFSKAEKKCPFSKISEYVWIRSYAPFTRIRFCLKKEVFFISGLSYHPHVSGENSHRKLIFSKTLSRVKIFENASFSFTLTDENGRFRVR